MPQSLIGLKQIKSGEIGSYITGAFGFGVTGVDSISIYKDLFVTGKSTFSGEASFNNDVTFKEEAFFNSGAKFSGDITGYQNLIVSGNSLISEFKKHVSSYRKTAGPQEAQAKIDKEVLKILAEGK